MKPSMLQEWRMETARRKRRKIFILALSFLLAIYCVNVLWHLAEQRRGTRELQTIYKLHNESTIEYQVENLDIGVLY